MKKFIEECKIFIVRLSSVRKSIRFLAVWALCWMLLIELVLIRIPACNEFIYQIGQIHLRLCYSFLSAFIFFLLAVHWPKETRKIKVYRLINNKVLRIEEHISVLIHTIFESYVDDKTYKDLTREELDEQCKKVMPLAIVKVMPIGRWPSTQQNWYNLVSYIKKQVKEDIHDIMVLNESVDNNVLESLTFINDIFTNFLSFDSFTYGNEDLTFMSRPIYDLKMEANILRNNMLKAYRKYNLEYHKGFRKRRV